MKKRRARKSRATSRSRLAGVPQDDATVFADRRQDAVAFGMEGHVTDQVDVRRSVRLLAHEILGTPHLDAGKKKKRERKIKVQKRIQ